MVDHWSGTGGGRFASEPWPDGERDRRRPGQVEAVANAAFLIDRTTFRYAWLDTGGTPTRAGSYAFLQTAGDANSVISDFRSTVSSSAELRIHPTDANGNLLTAFYDTVQVGDHFDYRPDGRHCSFRFSVTRVNEAASPRSFGIEAVAVHNEWCSSLTEDPGARKIVAFVWDVPSGPPVLIGLPALQLDEPTGEGTYRLVRGLPHIIDVPPGIEIIYRGYTHNEPDPRDPGRPVGYAVLDEAETGALLYLFPVEGGGRQHWWECRL